MSRDVEEFNKKRRLYTDPEETGRILALGIAGKHALSGNEKILVDAVTASFDALGAQTLSDDEDRAERASQLYLEIAAARDKQVISVLQARLAEGKMPALKELTADLKSKDKQAVREAMQVYEGLMYLAKGFESPVERRQEVASPETLRFAKEIVSGSRWQSFRKAYEPVKRRQMHEVEREGQLELSERFDHVKRSLPLLLDQIYLGSPAIQTGKNGVASRLNDALDILNEAHRRKLRGTKSWVKKIREATETLETFMEGHEELPRLQRQITVLRNRLHETEIVQGMAHEDSHVKRLERDEGEKRER